MTNPPTHDPIRECALKLLDRATISLAAYGTRQSKELVVEINILLAEAKRTSAEKVAAPASAEGPTLEERLADLELRLGAINCLWQRYGNRLDALEARLEKRRDDEESSRLQDIIQTQRHHLVELEAEIEEQAESLRLLRGALHAVQDRDKRAVVRQADHLGVQPDQLIPRRCPLPVVPEKETQP